MEQRTPKQGDRFISKNWLRPDVKIADVKADPDNEEFYQLRVVTATRTVGGLTRVYHAAEGQTRSDMYFSSLGQENSVRRWL